MYLYEICLVNGRFKLKSIAKNIHAMLDNICTIAPISIPAAYLHFARFMFALSNAIIVRSIFC